MNFLKDKEYLKPLLLVTFETTTDRELVSVLVQRVSMSGSVWLGTIGGFAVGMYFIFYGLAKCSAGRCLYKQNCAHSQLIEPMFKVDNAPNMYNEEETMVYQAKNEIENRSRIVPLTYVQ